MASAYCRGVYLYPALVFTKVGDKGYLYPLALISLDCQVDQIDDPGKANEAADDDKTEYPTDDPSYHAQHQGLNSVIFNKGSLLLVF